MKDLKITEVQVDCSKLSQEQIDKMCEVVKRRGYNSENMTILTENVYFQYHNEKNFGVYMNDKNYTTLTYDQFIKLFDKPKKSLFPIIIEKGMKFRHTSTNKVFEIESVKDDKVFVYTSDKAHTSNYNINYVERYFKQGIWIPLPTTSENNTNQPDTKEETPLLTKGCVALFWDEDPDVFQIGHYCENNAHNTPFKHKDSITGLVFKNARPVTKEEVIRLLFGE